MPRATTELSLLADAIDRLARLEPSPLPVISLYLNLQADQHGKDNYETFIRKELAARARGVPQRSPERESYERDVERIEEYLRSGLPASANGLAIFACSAQDLFEALVLEAPIGDHRLSIGSQPHLYPLEVLINRHPPHAVVLADSHAARIFVFALGRTVSQQTVLGERINRHAVGGWSQMRYQRHVDEMQAQHARELVQALEQVVEQEGIERIILAGDDVNVPLIGRELSPPLAEKVIDVLKLEPHTPEQQVMRAAAVALERHDARTDAEVVERVLGDYRAGSLAVVGPEDTREALERGQVDELLLTAVDALADASSVEPDELVRMALQTSARVRIIEDPALLADVGGVAAALRYRLDGRPLGKGRTYEQAEQRES